MMQAGREIVGSGPVALPSATDEKAQKALDMLKVPLRFVSPKSRTVMAVPSNFDPICSIGNSNKVPGYDLVRCVYTIIELIYDFWKCLLISC